ncbi:MAG: MFS transporter [Betaproteobacteria bacterium]|nr:MFS transporter [Betaproteobacteria bacterium]
MTAPDPSPAPPAPGFAFLLFVLLAAQTVGTMATTMMPAVAPKIAETYGVSSSLIGYQISLLAAAMLVSLVFGGNLNVRWGACRVTQVALSLLIAGCVIAVLPHVAFVFLSAIALGLGYGLMTPSASHLLARFTPARNRNLIFSFKQTGVPLGGIGAAVITPAVAVAVGWKWALAGTAVALFGLVLLMQRGRARWDDDRKPRAISGVNPFGGIATIWSDPALRLLSISGGCFVIVQICISTFTVVLFAEEMKFGLIEAGIVLMASQVGGVCGRVFWGWLADVTRNCFTVLAVLAGVMLVAALLCVAVTPAWPVAAACILFFVFGSTASGWNGAFLAEVARLAPGHAISSATGGSLVFVNIGKMLGPIAFANAYLLGGSYALAFGLLAVPAAAGLWCLLAARAGVPRAAAGDAR